jgi:hypothetical protein
MDPTSLSVQNQINIFINQMKNNNRFSKNIDVSGFQFQIVEKLTSLPHISRAGIPCVLTDIEASRYGYQAKIFKIAFHHFKILYFSFLIIGLKI